MGVLVNIHSTPLAFCMTKLRIISLAFFMCFYNKLKIDFCLNSNSHEKSHLSTCYTHVKGVKCELTIDMDSKSVKVSGLGHRL